MGPVSVIVELGDGRMCRRHFNHLRVRHDARPERVQVKECNIQPDDRAQATWERKAVVTGANEGPTVTRDLSDPPFTHPLPTRDFWAYPPVKIILDGTAFIVNYASVVAGVIVSMCCMIALNL